MADTLEIIINAKDNTSGVFGKLTGALGDVSKFATGMIVADVFGKLATGVSDFFTGSIGEAREAIANQKELEAVIKSTGGVAGVSAEEANSYAEAISKVTNFTDDAVLKGENMLLTFTNIGEDVFPRATQAMVDMGAKFGNIDTAAIQLGKALNDPIKGVGALSRIGVTFTEQQKEQIKAMVEAGDVAGAQGVILAELERQVGGLAEAVADPAIQMQNAWADAQETMGMAVIPVLNKLSQFALPMITSAVQFVIPYIEQFGGWLLSLVEYILFVVEEGDTLNDWLTHLPEPMQPIIRFIGDMIVAIQDFGAWIVNTAVPALQQWSDAYVMPALEIFINDTLPFLWQKAQEVWTWIQTTAIPTLRQWGESFNQDILPVIQDFANNALATLWTKGQEIWAWITGTAIPGLQEWGNTVSEFLAPKFADLKALLDQFMMEVLPPLQEAWSTLQEVWTTEIMPALDELWIALQDLFKELGFGTGETDVWRIALGVLKKFLDDAVVAVNALAPVIRILSQVITGAIDKIRTIADTIRSMKSAASSAMSTIENLANKIRSLINSASRIPSWLRPGSPTPFELGIRGIGDAVRNLPDMQTAFNVGGGIAPLANPALAGAGVGGGGSPIVVNLTYSPVVSTADKFELERVLTEVVNDINRKRS